MQWLWLLGLILALVPGVTLAEDAESLRQALETMRQEFESMKQQYERRMQDLSDRIKHLEAQPASPTPPAPAPTPTPAPALPQASERPALRELLTPRQPFATAQPGLTLVATWIVAAWKRLARAGPNDSLSRRWPGSD